MQNIQITKMINQKLQQTKILNYLKTNKQMKRTAPSPKVLDTNRQLYSQTQSVNQQNQIDFKSIQFLQKKYEQQKSILVQQNKRLEQKLIKQLNQIEQRRFSFQKKQQRYRNQIQTLIIQNESLKNKLQLKLVQQKDPESFRFQQDDEEEENQKQKNYLEKHKELILKYQALENQYNQLQQAVIMQDQEKQIIMKQNKQMNQHIDRLKIKILKDQEEFNKVKQLLQQYTKQKEQINLEYQQFVNKINGLNQEIEKERNTREKIQEELTKTRQKLQQQKRKKKQTERHLIELQGKLTAYQKQQRTQYEGQIQSLKRQIQSQKQKYTQILTKLSFNDITIQKKDIYIKQLQSTIREINDKKSEYENRVYKLEKTVGEYKQQVNKLNVMVENVREEGERQRGELKVKYENEVMELKKKTIEELYPILKDRNEERSKKNFQLYLRNCKSSTHFQKIPVNFVQQYNNHNHNHNQYQNVNNEYKNEPNQGHHSININNQMAKYKLQSQLNQMQMQNINLKKQIQQVNNQMMKIKQEKMKVDVLLDSRGKQIQQHKLRMEKVETMKNGQILEMRKQLSKLRSKQTETLQLIRDRQEYEQAMNLKISFYDKKIKQLLENIQRKDNIIQKYKIQKLEIEEKLRFYQQKIEKYIDENEGLRRTKNDLNRKDDLFKDYKFKYEKLKGEFDEMKESVETMKKEKIKIQTLLDSKEEYVNGLKKKHQKNIQEIQKNHDEKVKNMQTKVIKVTKENYQNKIKKLKKQLQSSVRSLDGIKKTILGWVEKQVNKKSKKNKKIMKNDYQGAQLLGLNDLEIMDFINPDQSNDKVIVENLEELWESQQFQEFVNQTINYVRTCQ